MFHRHKYRHLIYKTPGGKLIRDLGTDKCFLERTQAENQDPQRKDGEIGHEQSCSSKPKQKPQTWKGQETTPSGAPRASPRSGGAEGARHRHPRGLTPAAFKTQSPSRCWGKVGQDVGEDVDRPSDTGSWHVFSTLGCTSWGPGGERNAGTHPGTPVAGTLARHQAAPRGGLRSRRDHPRGDDPTSGSRTRCMDRQDRAPSLKPPWASARPGELPRGSYITALQCGLVLALPARDRAGLKGHQPRGRTIYGPQGPWDVRNHLWNCTCSIRQGPGA